MNQVIDLSKQEPISMKFLEDFKDATLHYYDQLMFVLPRVVLGILVFVIILFVSNRLKTLLKRYLNSRLEDTLVADFSARIFKTVLVLVGLLVSMSIMGLGKAASGLLAGAGVSAFIIGFAFKDIGENFLAGFIMAFDRPFRVGDWVMIASHEGTIVSLSLRDVHLKSFDGKDVFIPNGMIVRNPIVNYTIDGFLRHSFNLRIGSKTDTKKATDLLYSTINNIKGVLDGDRASNIFIKDYDQNGFIFKIQYWLKTNDPAVSGIAVKNLAISQCIENLQKAGIELSVDKVEVMSV